MLTVDTSFVLLAATSTFFINSLHVVLTSNARKASGLKYPIPYASNDLAEKDSKAYKFNCGMHPQTPSPQHPMPVTD